MASKYCTFGGTFQTKRLFISSEYQFNTFERIGKVFDTSLRLFADWKHQKKQSLRKTESPTSKRLMTRGKSQRKFKRCHKDKRSNRREKKEQVCIQKVASKLLFSALHSQTQTLLLLQRTQHKSRVWKDSTGAQKRNQEDRARRQFESR